jgi:hypothetical protein
LCHPLATLSQPGDMLGGMDTHRAGRARTIADRQHGVITRRQALAVGFTDMGIRTQVSSRAWTRIKPGVFLTAGRVTSRTLIAAATVTLAAVASHQSAAELHGLPHIRNAGAIVSIPHRLSNRFPGVVVHESTDLDDQWITDVDGLPTTTIGRTLFDLGSVLPKPVHRSVVEQSVADRRTSIHDLADVLAALGRRGRPGTTPMRELLEEIGPGAALAESQLERMFLDLIFGVGVPAPQLQADLPWRTRASGRVDFLFPEHRLIVECDGRRWHTTSEAFERDRRRDNLAQLAGWSVLRFTWEDLTSRSGTVLQQVKAALRTSRAA